MMKRMFIIVSILVLILVSFSLVNAENGMQGNTRFSLYYMINSWKTDYKQPIGEDKLNQGVFGLSLAFAPNDKFRLDLNGALTNTKYTAPDDAQFKLSSVNDTKLRATYFVADGKGSASLYVNLPTGKKELTPEEYGITTAISDISRKFLTRRYGQGLDIGTDWYALPRFGKATLQVGGGYLYHGKYQILKADTRKYKYGDQISGKVGVMVDNKPFGGSIAFTARYYLKDKFDDKEIFQAGVTSGFNLQVTYSDMCNVRAGISTLSRAKAKVRSSGEETISDEALKSGRNEALFYLDGSYPFTEKVNGLGRIEYLSVSANEYTKTDLLFRPKSHYVGLSGGAGYAFTETLSGSLMASYYTGKIDEDFGLSGFGLALVVTFRAK